MSEELSHWKPEGVSSLNPELISATAEQIRKDFSFFSVDPGEELAQSSTWEELYKGLDPVIGSLVRDDKPKLMQIIYRVDLSEKAIANALENCSRTEAVSRLTALIIERECRKVIARSGTF